MKIPDAYIAKGDTGVGAPAQYPLGPAMAEGQAMVHAGQSMSFLGAVMLNLNKGLNDAKDHVQAEELSLQVEPLMQEHTKNYRMKWEADHPNGVITDSLVDYNKSLTEVGHNFVSGLTDVSDRVKTIVRGRVTQTHRSIYDAALGEWGKDVAATLKGKLDHNLSMLGSEIASMPLNKTANGQTDLENLTQWQHARFGEMDNAVLFHAQKGLIFPHKAAEIMQNNRLDVTMQAINNEVHRGPTEALNVLNRINRGEPIFGITDKTMLKPVMDAAMQTYNNHVSMTNTKHTQDQRDVVLNSEKSRDGYALIIERDGVNVSGLANNDPTLTDNDRANVISMNEKKQEHVRSGPKTSDFDTYNLLTTDLAPLHFGGSVKDFRKKVYDNQLMLKADDRAYFLKQATDAEVNQRTLKRAKSSDYVKALYDSGKKFLQQSVPFVQIGPNQASLDENKAYSVLGKITEQVILNPEMTTDQVDQKFYPLLYKAYTTLKKPNENPTALKEWIDKIPSTGEAAVAKNDFTLLYKGQVAAQEKAAQKKLDADKAVEPEKLEQKEPWEWGKTYKDLTDKAKKAWGN